MYSEASCISFLGTVPLSAGAVVRQRPRGAWLVSCAAVSVLVLLFPAMVVKLRLRSRCNFRSRSSLAALYRDHAAFRLGGGTQTCTHADIRPAPARPLTGRRYEVSASAPVTLARGFTTTFAGIAINHVPGFVLAQLAGAAIGALVANLLFGREVAQQGHS